MVLGFLGGMIVIYINNGKLFFGFYFLVGLGMMGAIVMFVFLIFFM